MKNTRWSRNLWLSLILLNPLNFLIADEVGDNNPNTLKLVTIVMEKEEHQAFCGQNVCSQAQPVFTLDSSGNQLEIENLVSLTYFKDYGEQLPAEKVVSVVEKQNILVSSMTTGPGTGGYLWFAEMYVGDVAEFCMTHWCVSQTQIAPMIVRVTYWTDDYGPLPPNPLPGGGNIVK